MFKLFMKGFASDNYAGVLPEVMAALQQANVAHARSYGADDVTKKTTSLFSQVFETDVDVFFVFNGTGANVLSISASTLPYSSVLCADTSHIYCDESTAPETFTGCRFVPIVANEHGKLDTQLVQDRVIRRGDIHFAQPTMVSITQATEYGTVYNQHEIEDLSRLARANNMYLHMDGARFFNAAASLQCSPAAITSQVGVDILSLGGTKAGMMYGEAVIVFNKQLARDIAYRHKQVMQLASKTRFIAAQFSAMLTNNLWQRTATHANDMARLLRDRLATIPEIRITRPVQANAVFAEMPKQWYDHLSERFPFYIWKESTMEVRLMCSWDTALVDIIEFTDALNSLSKKDTYLTPIAE
jgi:threonine aldolase